MDIVWANPGFVLSTLIAAISFIFGLGVALAGFRWNQAVLNKNVAELMADVSTIKIQLQERKALFITKPECNADQSRCQRHICDKLEELKLLIEKDRDRLQSNAVDIKGLESKLDMVLSNKNYGRNSG